VNQQNKKNSPKTPQPPQKNTRVSLSVKGKTTPPPPQLHNSYFFFGKLPPLTNEILLAACLHPPLPPRLSARHRVGPPPLFPPASPSKYFPRPICFGSQPQVSFDFRLSSRVLHPRPPPFLVSRYRQFILEFFNFLLPFVQPIPFQSLCSSNTLFASMARFLSKPSF